MSEIQLKSQSNATTDTPSAGYKSLFYSSTYNTFAYKDENGTSYSLVGVTDSDPRLSSFNIVNVKQNPGTGEYSSITSALAAITTNSASNPYLIKVGAGVFTESVINMKPYVFVIGSGDGATIIEPSNPAVSLINGYEYSQICSVFIRGVTGSGVPAIYYSAQTGATNGTFIVHDVTFGANDTHLRCYSNQAVSTVIVTDCYFGDGYQFNNGMLCDNNGSYDIASKLICSNVVVNGTSAPQPNYAFKVTGVNTKLSLNSCSIRATNITSGSAILVEDGAEFDCNGLNIEKFAKGIYLPNTGNATSIKAFGVTCVGNTLDVDVDHVGASGTVFGPDDFQKITIVAASSVNVFGKDRNIVTVRKYGGDFTSVSAACDYIKNSLSPSSTNRYLVQVGPGVFNEPIINPPSYCSVTGSTIQPTVIVPDGNHHAFYIDVPYVELSFLTINDVNSTKFGVFYENLGGAYGQMHKISMNNSNGVKLSASSSDTLAYLEYVDFNGDYLYGIDIVSTGGFQAYINAENYYNFPTANTIYQNRVDGSNAELDVATAGSIGITTDTAYYVKSGASLRINACYADNSLYGVRVSDGATAILSAITLKDCVTGIYSDNTGSNADIHVESPQFIDCTTNVNINNATTSGNLTGYTARSKTTINASAPFFISNFDSNIITVAKKGGDFNSIKDAVDYVVTLSPSVTNQFIISVGPGTYLEDKITGYEYISVVSDQATIEANDPSDNLIVGADGFTLQGFNLKGVTDTGIAAVYYNSSGNEVGSVFTLRDVTFEYCDVLVELVGTAAPSTLLMQACAALTHFDIGFKITNSGTVAQLVMNGFNYQAISAPLPSKMFDVSGSGASLNLVGCLFKTSSGVGTFIEADNGALVRIVSTMISGFQYGVKVPNIGSAPELRIEVLGVEDCTYDIDVDHTGAFGSIKGSYDRTKVSIVADAADTLTITYTDPENGGFVSAGPLYLGSQSSELTDALDLIESAPTMGLMDGGELSAGAGFVVNVAAGFGYLMTGSFPDHILLKHEWNSTSITLSANVDVYIYFNSSLTLTSNAAYPETSNVILLGRAVTNGSTVELIDLSPLDSHHAPNKMNAYFRDVFGTFVSSGLTVTENATARKLDITSGVVYQSYNKFSPASGTAFTWTKVIRDGASGYTLTTSQDTVPNDKYDDNSGTEATVGTNKYARHWLYQSGEGSLLKRYLVLSQAEYNSQLLAEAGTAPTVPSWFKDGVIRVASIITKQGTSNIISIIDERPRPASASSAATGVSDHGALTGLSDDDHPQYLLADGTRALTGDLSMGGNDLTSVGTINSVTVETHKSRHYFNGADAFLSATPQTIGTANSEGVSNTEFSRADHVHAHGAQTDGALHAAVVAGGASGFMTGTDKTKLDGIATGATANQTDAFLLSRANHTGTQTASTISDFNTAADARITAQRGAANGIASLDASALLPSAQHGSYSSGTHHAAATTSVAGFMSAADKTKVDSHGTRVALRVTATQATTLNTYSAVTELTTGTLATGNYIFQYQGLFQSSAAATGVGFRLGAGTATITPCFGKWLISAAANGTAANFQYDQLTATTDVVAATTPVVNTDAVCVGWGSFTVTVSGTVAIQFRSENAGTSVSVRAGSVLRIESV
jgi:hypothetical protein